MSHKLVSVGATGSVMPVTPVTLACHAKGAPAQRRLPLVATAIATLAALAALASGPVLAQQLIAPDATIAGFSQSELAAQFAQWSSDYPVGANPTRDDTGAFSALGNRGSYFFLGASGTPDPIVRSVTVRPDQTLFVSILSYLDYAGGDVQTEAQIRQEVAYVLGVVSNLSVTVDGAPALLPAGFSSLQQFHQSSPLFSIVFIDNNIYGVPPDVLPAVADGFFFGLEGLPLGEHSLHFTAHSEPTGPFAGLFSFGQDITYNISSVPEASTRSMLSLGLLAMGAGALQRRRRSAQS